MSPWIEVGNQVRWTPNEEHAGEEPRSQRSQAQGELLKEVRRRDGDQCRVCRVVVSSPDRKHPNALNYRILNPGTALTMDGVVVVCRVHMADGDILPAPAVPYCTVAIRKFLLEHVPASVPPAAAPVVETEAAPEFPIDLNFFPAARSRELNDVVELIKSLPLLVRMGAGDRAVLTIAAKTAHFLEGLLSWAVVVDDEGRLSLADDQGSIDRGPLRFHGRALVDASQSSCEGALQLLRQRFAAELPVVDAEPLSVDDDLSHKTSPSVGAPNSAVRDNSNPTEGELDNQGGVAS